MRKMRSGGVVGGDAGTVAGGEVAPLAAGSVAGLRRKASPLALAWRSGGPRSAHGPLAYRFASAVKPPAGGAATILRVKRRSGADPMG